jgi:hypothetical protein
MNQGPWGDSLMKKAKGQNSHDTDPLKDSFMKIIWTLASNVYDNINEYGFKKMSELSRGWGH